MLFGEGRINANAVEEVVEHLLVGPFAHCLVAFGALEVPGGLLKNMGICRCGMVLLCLQCGWLLCPVVGLAQEPDW